MIHQSKSYLKFLRKSKNQHGVHSPFVYNLVTTCFYDRQLHTAYELLKQHRKSVLKDKSALKVTDLGAGSKVFKGSRRIAKSVGKIAGTRFKRAKLLNRLVRYLDIEIILELGTSVGLGTGALAAGNENTNITTIEGCPETAQVAAKHFNKLGFENITIIQSDFESTLKKLTQSFDLIFIDGNHTKEATLQYFETVLPHIHNDSVIIFDDIYLTKQMTRAWEAIKAHKKVTVTIDTFKWGFVFFRNEQAKEHFTIRM